MAKKWILAAIDGSGSDDWGLPAKGHRNIDRYNNEMIWNSYVNRFYQDFKTNGGYKDYFHGPRTDGLNTGPIVIKVCTFLAESIRKAVPALSKMSDQDLVYPGIGFDSSNSKKVKKVLKEADIEICLIGHSRGGHVALVVAQRLYIKVQMLGLYDAVDRSPVFSPDSVSNVNYVYHALRGLNDSRTSFGNTGPIKSNPANKIFVKKFKTSHGGIGGDWVMNPSWGDDYSCSIEKVPVSEQYCAVGHTTHIDRCENESLAANKFIRKGARNAGILLSGS